jgi:signal transduction histidine kinase
VAVRYEPTAIGVEIRSQRANPPAAEPGASGGQGLVGMRERVERFGGQLAAGPEPSGAYVVRARIPVPGGET